MSDRRPEDAAALWDHVVALAGGAQEGVLPGVPKGGQVDGAVEGPQRVAVPLEEADGDAVGVQERERRRPRHVVLPAQVPALLEMLKIPYTGSRVLANGISLDKTLTKRIWRDRRLPVASFQEFSLGDEPLRTDLEFPLFVKPAREGTGMGVDMNAIVNNEQELRERVEYIINTYQQPALVEAFLPGREFTVGILGRADAKLYSRHPDWYEKDGFHRFPILELDMTRSVTPLVYSKESKSKEVGEEGAPGYVCPAEIEPELEKKLKSYALRAHLLLNALDVSRTDIRLDKDGNPRVMEINTLPGLTPNYSDLCLQSAAEGLRYEDLILEILYLGASRWGMVEPREVGFENHKKK